MAAIIGSRIWGFPIAVYTLLMLIGYAWNWVTIGVADPHTVEAYLPIEALPPIFMFLSVLGLGIAWRWERLGGAITIVFQLAALSLLLLHSPITHDFPRFLVCWWRSRKRAIPNDSA